MKQSKRNGFSVIEVLVAISVLGIGLLVLAGGALGVTRDLTRSRKSTVASGLANAKLDQLRNAAASTSPNCTASAFAGSSSSVTGSGVTMSWSVSSSGALRTVRVITSYSIPRGGTVVDTLVGLVPC